MGTLVSVHIGPIAPTGETQSGEPSRQGRAVTNRRRRTGEILEMLDWAGRSVEDKFPSSSKQPHESVMNAIKARIRMAADHSISGVAPEGVPPGEHEIAITVVKPPRRRRGVLDPRPLG